MADRINIKQKVKKAQGNRSKGKIDIGYIYFMLLLGMVYIANTQIAERKTRKIQHLKENCKELNVQFMSEKSELMYDATYSKLESDLSATGVLPSDESPIVLSKKKS